MECNSMNDQLSPKPGWDPTEDIGYTHVTRRHTYACTLGLSNLNLKSLTKGTCSRHACTSMGMIHKWAENARGRSWPLHRLFHWLKHLLGYIPIKLYFCPYSACSKQSVQFRVRFWGELENMKPLCNSTGSTCDKMKRQVTVVKLLGCACAYPNDIKHTTKMDPRGINSTIVGVSCVRCYLWPWAIWTRWVQLAYSALSIVNLGTTDYT